MSLGLAGSTQPTFFACPKITGSKKANYDHEGHEEHEGKHH